MRGGLWLSGYAGVEGVHAGQDGLVPHQQLKGFTREQATGEVRKDWVSEYGGFAHWISQLIRSVYLYICMTVERI